MYFTLARKNTKDSRWVSLFYANALVITTNLLNIITNLYILLKEIVMVQSLHMLQQI
jgi:hypothetical protein